MRRVILSLLLIFCTVYADTIEANNEAEFSTTEDESNIMMDGVNKLGEDIVNDGLNLRLFASTTYFGNTLGQRDDSNGVDDSESDLLYVSVGVSLLPNTWDIRLSYSGVVADDLFLTEDYEGEYEHTSVYEIDPKEDPQYIDIYMKPIKTSWGDLGIGYRQYQLNYTVGRRHHDTSDQETLYMVDIANPNGPGALAIEPVDYQNPTPNQIGHVAYTAKTERYYLTYNFPDIEYVPRGLGIKYDYELSDQATLLQSHQYIIHPDVTTQRIGAGIYLTEDELETGINIKKLYYSMGQSNYEYYNILTSSEGTLDKDSTKWEAEITFAYKTDSNRIAYISAGGSSEEYEDSEALSQFVLTIGAVF